MPLPGLLWPPLLTVTTQPLLSLAILTPLYTTPLSSCVCLLLRSVTTFDIPL